jgi:predicted MFS family arabinose efflux permease
MGNDDAVEQLNKNITIFSLIVLGALGVMAFQVLPSLVIGMLRDLEFSQAQIGKVASWQLGGIAAGSIVSLWLVKIMSWRRLAYVGLISLVLTDVASMFIRDYTPFLAIRFLSGTAGGVCVSFASYALGNTRMADRNFGLFLAFQVVSAIVANMFLPGVVLSQGVIFIFITLVVLELLTLFILLRYIPNLEVKAQEAGGANTPKVWMFCGLQLLAILFFFIALGGFWTYIAPIGLAAGLTEQETGRAISFGLFGGLAGSFVAAQLNIRIGRLLPILTSVGLMFAALGLLYSGDLQFTMFVVGAGLFMFGWYMFFPYQLGMLAALDRDGRPLLLANAVAGIGSSLGPSIVALFIGASFLPVYTISAGFLMLALATTVLIVLISKNEIKAE